MPRNRTPVFSGISLAGPICWVISPRVFDTGFHFGSCLRFLGLVLVAAPIVAVVGVFAEFAYVICYPLRKLVNRLTT